jgi:hypothetical protein
MLESTSPLALFPCVCSACYTWIPGSLFPGSSRSQGPCCLVAPEGTSLPVLLHPGKCQLATQHGEPAATCTSRPQAPDFATLPAPGSMPPHSAQRLSTPHTCLQKNHFSPVTEQEHQLLYCREERSNLIHCGWHRKSASSRYTEAQHCVLYLPAEETLLPN